ncbi:MAG TPA: dienelactone hydrolase family protein [Croceicoccus sp.]|nr:dienelactone hydrolase family protein [Croceicoccus sp.]
MCDREQLALMAANKFDRRRFGGALAATGGAAMLGACTAGSNGEATAEASTAAATMGGVLTGEVAIPAPGGTIGGWFYHPSAGNHPAVIMWPDIAGVRPASKAMGERLAREGYAVLVPDPYWRDAGHAMFADFADFAGNGGFAKVTPWRNRFSAKTVAEDTGAIVAWLDRQGVVNRAQPMGARGHCMTGSWPIHAAKASERIRAAASMHGGGLVTDAPDSPHRQLVGAAVYHIAIAQNDDAKAPAEKSVLADALKASGAAGEVEVYPADHGWTVPDSPAYDKAQAERAYATFLAMLRAVRDA